MKSKQDNLDKMTNTESETVWFGYQRLTNTEKNKQVRSVFQTVAQRYDLMNDLMSFGLQRIWKAALIDWLNPRPGEVLLDIAGGTGDIAMGWLKRANRRMQGVNPSQKSMFSARAIICDLTLDMLQVGQDRALDCGLYMDTDHNGSLNWVCGNAEKLPFASNGADAYSIAFGLRNVARRMTALDEAYRVLKPGGRFACLEFSPQILPSLARLYDLYSFQLLPNLGQLVVGDAAAYRYLAESIRTFPNSEKFHAELASAGFVRLSHRPMSGGIVMLHTGWHL